ncbi:Cd(II)/Pb(II)-responsive transcriptional regulator [Tepidicella baoligensis]|uniref:Cd(II)/Pb(II)-responsive transcriptional regulator n=1 Tax=Tepidicella baoligensis TaxID=2707016 RepID=UPI0015D9B1B6|nr:Cd(II)/Pb(II)-responsive transcriptional regulator [Tepidicella baoligensis]
MQIKELARATGVDAETIRFYEKQGLLPSAARRDNGYRDYTSLHLERLSFIRHCRALDMPLADVARLLSFLDEPDSHCGEVNELVDAQLARVRARLQSMLALEKQLLLLRSRCQATNAGHCGILKELVAAAQGEACACHGAAPPEGQAHHPRSSAHAI